MKRHYCRSLVVMAMITVWLCMGGTALASTNYGFILGQNWIPPKSTVELGSLTIEVEPLTDGEHSALFELPNEFKITLPVSDIASLQDPAVSFSASLISENEFIGTINNSSGYGKYTFVIPLRSTIPRDIRGDIELKITLLKGQLMDGVVVAGAALPGELTIESRHVSVIKDGKSTVQIIFSENMSRVLIRNAPIKLTLPDGFVWANAKFDLVSGESLDVRLITDGRVLDLRTNSESTKRSSFRIDAEVRLVDPAKVREGEVRAVIEGLRNLSSRTILVAHYEAPEPAQPEPAKPQAVFTVGNTRYKHHGMTREMDVAPYLRDGRVFLPLRYVGVSLDVDEIDWDGQMATLVKDDIKVQVTTGIRDIIVNGKVLTMDVAPELVLPGRIMLPYRYIAEAFDASVAWDEASRSVLITLGR